MIEQPLLIRDDLGDGVTQVTLNRGPVNALSATFLMAFDGLIKDLSADPSVKAIVLSSPFKVFSAGLDLKEAQAFDLEAQHAIVRGLNIAFLTLFACPKPTVCAINGPAIAGGLFFVLGSDVRVSSDKGQFGLAEIRVGADFPIGPLEIARATMTPDAMRHLMLTGLPITATRAEQIGLIDHLTAPEAVVKTAVRAARQMATSPPNTFAKVKRQIRGATIERIEKAMAEGANAPENGWFTEETKAAMQRMIG